MRVNKIVIKDHMYLPNSKTGKFTYEFSDNGLVFDKINIFVAPNGYGKSTLVNLLGEINRSGFNSNVATEITFETDSGEFKLAKNLNELSGVKFHHVDFKESPGYSYFSKRLITKKAVTSSIPIIEKCKKVSLKKLARDRKIMNADCVSGLLTKKNIEDFKCELVFDTVNIEEEVFELFERLVMFESQSLKTSMGKKRIDLDFYAKILDIVENSPYSFENSIALYACLKKIYATNEQIIADYILYKSNEEIFNEFKELFTTSFPNKEHDFNGKDVYRGYSFTMPLANTYSTGELDRLKLILNYITIKRESNNSKIKYVIFIDQLFDNVDHLNLVICLKLFDRLVGKNITVCFPTHLDQKFFKQIKCNNINYTHAIKGNSNIKVNSDVIRYVANRDNLDKIDGENFFSSYCAHFSPISTKVHMQKKQYSSIEFTSLIELEFKLYSENQEYCPLSVAFYLRKKIEYACYKKLKEEEKGEFLQKRGIIDKLNYASSYHEIPLSFFLFTEVMNDIAHIIGKNDYRIPFIKSKIEHITIKEIIKEICE